MDAGDATRAGIASRRAAQVYGAAILREHLEDHSENYTRFLLLATSADVAENADKLSLVLNLAHKPGSLCSALNAFARRNLNLLKIESRPIPGTPWSYCFYLDLQASLNNPETRRGAGRAERICRFRKNSRVLPASKGLKYLPRMALGSTGTPACALFETADCAWIHELAKTAQPGMAVLRDRVCNSGAQTGNSTR